jgi:glycosyltransferase involved in cell wall biosynthesis
LTGSPIRIAHLVYSFGPAGIQRGIAQVIAGLDAGRFEHVVVCFTRAGAGTKWLPAHIPVLELGKRPGAQPRFLATLAATLEPLRPRIIHSHNYATLARTAIARTLTRTPIHVHSEHSSTLGLPEGSPLRRELAGWSLRRVDALVAVGEHLREPLARVARLAPGQIRVIPNGVGPRRPVSQDERLRLRESIAAGAGSVVIGSVGRLEPVKGYLIAVETLQRLVASGHDARLLVIGEGVERAAILERASRLGVGGRVHLPGVNTDPDPWLAAMDIYLCSSDSEGLSRAVLEAMSAGLPLVVTDVGDHARVVGRNARCGLVVPRRDVDSLAAALMELVGSRDRRIAMGRRAKIRQRRDYDLRAWLDRWNDLYLDLVQGLT